MKKLSQGKKGFTLIEILVALGIVAIALVLAARSQDKLAQVARECEALGASTLVRVTGGEVSKAQK